MAIGIALLLGFKIPMNFNAPLTADSMTDFWRRWHISLSTWIRDYVYISLGGNKKGTLRMYFNQMVAMTACGLLARSFVELHCLGCLAWCIGLCT